ncbi:MAG: hypothetical protein R2827_00635 [Bdellovibrionales bacterium]
MRNVFPDAPYMRGYWTNNHYQKDNYETFRESINNGASFEQAAFATHTGKVAKSLGFNGVYLKEEFPHSRSIQGLVEVLFYRDSVKKDVELIHSVKYRMEMQEPAIDLIINRDMHPDLFGPAHMKGVNSELIALDFWKTIVGNELYKLLEKYNYEINRQEFHSLENLNEHHITLGLVR